jgi:hypothetical protein
MSTLKFADGRELNLPEKGSHAKYMADTWRNGGVTPDGERLDWSSMAETLSPKNKDFVTTTEVRSLLAEATEMIIREPIEPLLAITNLYTTVQAKGLKTEILLGAMGAVNAGEVDELSPYPEVQFDIGGGIQVATISKSGIAASFSDEALRYTTWDLMAINLRLMAAAMARYTEWKAVSFLRSMGQTLFDNARPTSSVYGVCTGRDQWGAANGSMTMDDLMQAFTHMVETGYTPDTLVLSPQMYFMWVRDPVLRNLFHQGAGNVYFATYRGEVAPLPSWGQGAMGGRGQNLGYNVSPSGNAAGEAAHSGVFDVSNRATSAPNIPGYLGLPLRIIVSPMIPYDPSTKLGDIYLISSGMVGYRLIDEKLTTVEWRNEDIEAVKVKMRQRDAFAVAYEGAGISVFRNVANTQNFYHGHVQLTQTVSGTITEIDSDTPVV